jgi:bifunctional DNA-binding transcriptional regulator/antitoxin component of YhaV-PrlF toxin-antitoxin module
MANKVKSKKAPATRSGRTSRSRISTKNQITIPVEVLRAKGMSQGDEVEFVLNDAGFIEVHPLGVSGPLAFAGSFTHIFTGFDLEVERESWNR